MENILFEDLEINNELKRAVADMGFTEATPVQSQSILPMLEGKDMVVQAPTGTGKTCAFGLPIMEKIDTEAKHVEALILAPTRELAVQITNELMKLGKYTAGIRITPVYGGQVITRQITALKKRPQIIVATPGRLMDHLRRHTVKLDNLKYLVLDEADEMLNMGFREDIDTILESASESHQTVLYSATMSKEILDITKKYLHTPEKVQITKSEMTVPTIKQYYLEVRSENKIDLLARLVDLGGYEKGIVFCNTKRMVDELALEMTARGYLSEGLHGDMNQAQRDRVMRDFRNRKIDLLIATDVAARGIDVKGIEAVFNYDVPEDLEYYVHRIGRTGRAKAEGISYLFVTRRDMWRLREIMNYTKAKIEYMPIPKVAEITDIRVRKALSEATALADDGKLSLYRQGIEDFLSEHDTEITILDLAAALLLKDVGLSDLKDIEERPRSREKGAIPTSGNARIFINVGKLDKLKKRQLIKLLVEKVGLREREIRDISILEKFSFVNIPAEYAKETLKKLNNMRLDGRKIKAEISTGKQGKKKKKAF
ncbi:DEAD/DEAH box helicase [Ohessyouella blattaphilus]|uniref:RNA helicase n=1 Tax=Ohessyouella blattaphilus TaxID=2949333 RepID=A0ABT1EME0_9FIRM|nr:DEAD/DEAH box helicase [Ohessyouella blattaphilus]MCP1110866.1 DEAD/DEAH box helicase [Ohessyouella blattaphilus]MCR8564260.1 DEAD/DEAH box helicase [Ohessyouella blattaphilus]